MLPVGTNAKHVGAGSVFVFVRRRVLSGQVIAEVHFWPSGITACSSSQTILPGRGGSNVMQLNLMYLGVFLYLTLYLITMNLKPESCHLLLTKMPNALCAQRSNSGLKNLTKALWDWSALHRLGKIFVCHSNGSAGTLSQRTDVCGNASLL